MHIVFTLIGLLAGLLLAAPGRDEPWLLGAVLGAALGFLCAETRVLRARLRQAVLREPEAPLRPAPAAEPPAMTPERDIEPAPAARARSVAPPGGAVKAGPTLWQRGLRWLLSGNVPVKLGVLVSFFGVAFLLKYAADQGWLSLPVELKLAGVAAFGLALLAIGWRLRDRHRGYALSVQGGGIGVLYLTIFAAFRLFGLLPPGAAFALLVVLVIGASLLAWLQRAQALAVLGSVGGFLAPLLISTGGGNHVALFSYYTLLNLAVFGLAWFSRWRWLNLIGFFFTFGVGTVWGFRFYRPELFAGTEPFLVLNFLLYTAIAVLYGLRAPARLKGLVDGTLIFGTPVICFPLQAALLGDDTLGMAFSALAAAAIYVAFAALLRRLGRIHGRDLVDAFLALAVAFATIAVPLALSAQWTSAAWALEGAALVWVGVRQARRLPRLAGFALVMAGGVSYSAVLLPASGAWPLLNGPFLGAVLLAGAAYAAALQLSRRESSLDAVLAATLYGWGLFWLLLAGVVQSVEFVPDRHMLDALVLWLAVLQALNLLVAKRSGRLLFATSWYGYLPALGLLALVAIMLRELPLEMFGWFAWPAALAVHHAGSHFALPGEAYRRWLRSATLWVAGSLLAGQAQGLLSHVLQAAPVWGVAAALAVLALTVETGLRLAVRRAEPAWAYAGAAPVLGLLLGWVLAANPVLAGDPAPLPYLPLLNPLDLMSLIALLLAWRCWRGFAWLRERRALVAGAAGLAGLFLLTCMLARAVHHWGGVPYDWVLLGASVRFQAALSIAWALAGLTGMLLGARRGQRALWFAAAALMGLVVLKLFLVDLGNSGTVERIVSFIGVGLLLLVVGYFAPAPARGGQKS